MSRKSTPTYTFNDTVGGLVIKLTGSKGGVRHTYGTRTLEPGWTNPELLGMVEELHALIAPPLSAPAQVLP